MLRVHCVRVCDNLSDPAMEDLLYEAKSVDRFCGLNLNGPIPEDATLTPAITAVERVDAGTVPTSDDGDSVIVRTGVDESSAVTSKERQPDPDQLGRQSTTTARLHLVEQPLRPRGVSAIQTTASHHLPRTTILCQAAGQVSADTLPHNFDHAGCRYARLSPEPNIKLP